MNAVVARPSRLVILLAQPPEIGPRHSSHCALFPPESKSVYSWWNRTKINARLRRNAMTVLAFLVCAATAAAQQYSFQYYGVDQGLTDLAVRSLFRDRKGFLWLSTESGIFRYDGAHFQSYGEKDGIPASNAAVFGEAPDGSLLAGTNSGLYRLTENQFKQIPMPGAAKVSFGSGIQSNGSGRSWIATDGGLLEVTRNGGADQLTLAMLPSPQHLGSPAAYGVFAEEDVVWWGCGLELCVAEGGKTRVFGRSLGLAPSPWKGIVRARNGDLWVQSKGGDIAVMRSGKTAFEMPDLPKSRFGPKGLLSVDKGGRVLVPVGAGLMIQEGKHHWRQIDRRSGLIGPVYAILQDREGSLWLGLSGHGLARWLGYREWEYFNSDSGLGSDVVYEVLPVPGAAVWAGTDSGLFLGRRVGGDWNWRRQTNIGDTPVHSVVADRQGRLWLGTEGQGAARLETQTGQVEWFYKKSGLAESPYTLMLDRENRIWAGTLTGLFVADLKALQFHLVEQVPAVPCLAVIEAPNGEIWVGTAKGLFRLAGERWQRLAPSDGLSHNEVLSLAADDNGNIWVGYQFAAEIDRIHPSGGRFAVVRDVTSKDDSKGTTYFLGFDAERRLWAGTNRGLDVSHGATWRHYDQHDGVVWDDCDLNGFAAAADGTVWIGTSGGLAHFTPSEDVPWKDPPVAIFTKVTLGRTSMDPAQNVSVAYDANALATSYSALTFAREAAVIFRYRLAPLFREWRETRARELQFPGLPPNSYRLDIQARDGWARWSAESATFSFVIRPPWWRSWWFVSLLAAASLLAPAVIYRWRSRAARQRERDLVRLVDARTMELKQVNGSLQQASSQLEAANRDLTRLATIDGLTGIPNRRMFDQTLEIAWALARRSGPLSLIMVDIDHFKRLNDTAGHQKGDESLKLIAVELAKVTRRPTDFVARVGGEEFAVILPGTDSLQAARLAESARLGVQSLGIRYSVLPAGATVTISLGIATAIGHNFPSAEALTGAADGALYAAKRQGRNKVVVHTEQGCPDEFGVSTGSAPASSTISREW
jgi:diguanylate cyclase (GGDEF)-like protein